MLWAALLLPPGPDGAPPSDEALRGVATWALQFTPRVATSEEAVLLELEADANRELQVPAEINRPPAAHCVRESTGREAGRCDRSHCEKQTMLGGCDCHSTDVGVRSMAFRRSRSASGNENLSDTCGVSFFTMTSISGLDRVRQSCGS